MRGRLFSKWYWLIVALVTLGAPLASAPLNDALAQMSGGRIDQVVITGSQRIEPETVRTYLYVQEGDPFNQSRINRSLKSLYSTGMFADVSISRDGNRLVVAVVENPVINRIAFEGNKKHEDADLENEVSLRPRVIFTKTKVQADIKRLLTLYRRSGRFAATVEPKIIQLPQNRIDLVFEIDEGPITEVKNIRFLGNKTFSDSKLRDVVRTRESRWWRFLSSDDNYDPDRITFDKELLRRYYMRNGFADIRVVSAVAELMPNRDAFFITFTLDEGTRYKIDKVETVARLRNLDAKDIEHVVEIEKGDWYDADAVDDTIDRLTDTIGIKGFAFVEVRPRVNRNPKEKTINLAFEIGEGPRVFVERIEVEGNVRTIDEVIRREFRLVEGDAFNAAKLRRSRVRIRDLDFFETVEFSRSPGSAPDKTVIHVGVEEKSTGSFEIGAGFSTSRGPVMDTSLNERNFMGRGQAVKLALTIAGKQSKINLSFTEPYFLDRDVAAGFDVFHSKSDFQDTASHDEENTGFGLRIGYPVTDKLRQSWNYSLKRTIISNVSDTASRLIREQAGERLLSAVGHRLSHDTRDSRLTPTEGHIVTFSNDLAGFGGDARYLKNRLSGTQYFNFGDDWVFSLQGEVGHIVGIGEEVELPDRFTLGGDDLRGFASSGVGPRDGTTMDSLGGEWKYRGSAEMRFPLGLPTEYSIAGRLFSDFGAIGTINPSGPEVVDSGSIRLSVGAGITWVSPMGPIGVDVGFPILKDDIDVTETIRINFGTRF